MSFTKPSSRAAYAASLVLGLLGLAPCAHAGHWIVVSMANATYPISTVTDSSVTRGASAAYTAVIPAGGLYGSGSFPVYGEDDLFSKKISSANPSTQTYQAGATNYYQLKYRWVADLPNETPPPPTANVPLYGYSLERAELSNSSFTRDSLEGNIRNYSYFWAHFDVFTGPYDLGGFQQPYGGQSHNWPATGGITFRGSTYNVRSLAFTAAGNVSVNALGQTVCDATVSNHVDVYEQANVASPDPSITTMGFRYGGTMRRYLGVTQILGYPVN